ncbi:hypothetical protein EAO73_30645 [Streptomyces sp. col6]|uniref:hypothetical protein n=1 Tax=Streptomyces sp. col6 TaxID=2478958 RepID=UPI0011CDE8AD|nr:hypothetical protein [Streptomyces sp. col6]TXR95935.1 hypothetical protein EAO73_30645 [Streptomyces sp. col6]
MESQSWRGLTVTWTRPHVADIAVAGVVYYLLHQDGEVHRAVAGLIALITLRCIRIRRSV